MIYKADVSFITINYNSSKYTIKLLKSIAKHTQGINYEIIIVDNNSSLNDYNQLNKFCNSNEDIKLIRNKLNSGFASGNMLGVNYASGEYFFFINNDTELLNNSANIMKKYLDNNDEIALATAKVNDENGNFSSSYKLFPSITKELLGNSIVRKLSKNKFPSNRIKLNEPTLVEVVSGSFMFFRAKPFCDIGGFDTTFFLYCEEEDISKRIWNNNKKVIFLPEAEIFHASGGSTKQNIEIKKEYYISYKHLISKHFNFLSAYILFFLQQFKLFRRSFKSKNGFQLFYSFIFNCKIKNSLKYKQKIHYDTKI